MVACRNETWRSHFNGQGFEKIGYSDKGEAKRKARQIGKGLEVYRCGHCDKWHMGKRPKERAA